MTAINGVSTTVLSDDYPHWPIRDNSGTIVGSATSADSARYISSAMSAVEVRVINHG